MTDNEKMREAFEDCSLHDGYGDDRLLEENREWFIAGWQAAKSVPAVGEPVAWVNAAKLSKVRKGYLLNVYLHGGTDREIDNLVPLYSTPPTSITSAELERLRKDAAKVLHAEQIRIAAVAAIRAITGCPDIKGKDNAYLVDELIVRLIEMQDDAAIAAEGEKE